MTVNVIDLLEEVEIKHNCRHDLSALRETLRK